MTLFPPPPSFPPPSLLPSGRYSPAIIVPKFHGSNKNALDHKEDVLGYRPPHGTPCRICLVADETSCSYALTYLMLMDRIKEESDREKLHAAAKDQVCMSTCLLLETPLGMLRSAT